MTAALSPRFAWRVRRPLPGASRLSRFGFVRVNALAPKEQIRFLYLSLVRQTGKRGLRREPTATPTEFAQELNSRWPASKPEIKVLTEAFLEARYSHHEVDQRSLKEAKNAWMRFRRALSGRSGDAES